MLTEMQLRELGLNHDARERYVAAVSVASGAALLDERMPHWHWKIDLPTFDPSSMGECVLAQVFGAYEEGVAALNLPSLMDFQLGFVCSSRTHTSMLNDAWRRLVTERQGAHAPSPNDSLEDRAAQREILASTERSLASTLSWTPRVLDNHTPSGAAEGS